MRFLLSLLISFFIMFPIALFNYLNVTDPFLYYKISSVKSYESLITIPQSFITQNPSYDIILLILNRVLELDMSTIQFMPIGGVLFVLCFYSLAIRFVSKYFTIVALLILIYSHSHLIGFYAVFIHGWTYPLYFLFTLCMIKYLDKKNIETAIILIILFISVNTYYYTVASWIIVLSLVCSCFYWINYRRYFIVFPVLFTVIYLGFNNVIYETFLPHSDIDKILNGFSNFFNSFILAVGTREVSSSDIFLKQSMISSYLYVFIVFILALPIILKIRNIITIRNTIKSKINYDSLFLVVFIVTAIVDIVIYASYGETVILKYVILIIPLVSAICLKYFKNKFISKTLILTALILTIFRFNIAVTDSTNDFIRKTSIKDIRASGYWLQSNTNKNQTILTDFDTYGNYMIIGVDKSRMYMYDETTYKWLMKIKDYTGKKNNIIVFDVKSIENGIRGRAWRSFNSISRSMKYILSENRFSKVYDDSAVIILNVI